MFLFFLLRNLIQILTGVILVVWLILAGYYRGSIQYYLWALLVLALMVWMLRAKRSETRDG